jgi:hypothetical protein
MQPIAVFTEGDCGSTAWAVSDWPSAWRAIDAAYSRQELASSPLAWVLSVTDGFGPVTVLRLMDRVMWSALAEDWRALRAYVRLGDLTADPLLEPFA